MQTATWLRRAHWLAVFVFSIASAGLTWAQDEPRRDDGPPPREERGLRDERRGPERSSHYWLNMHVVDVPDSLADELKLEDDQGVVVRRVGDDGPAAKAGIKANDVILEVGDKKIKGPRDLAEAVNAADGKEISIKLLREGKPVAVAVTPGKRPDDVIKRLREGEFDARDLGDLERRIQEKLKDLGGDLRLQFIQPGRVFPPGVLAGDFPDDLTVNIRKEGKKPADVEVKKGDKTWNVKEDDLSQLPEDVRPHVEGMLGRGPLPFRIHLDPGGPAGRPSARRPRDVPGDEGPEGPDGPRPPRRPDGPSARRPPEVPDVPAPPDGPRPPRRGFRENIGPPRDAPEGRDREREGDRERGGEERMERRLHELDRRLQAMQEQIERLLKKSE